MTSAMLTTMDSLKLWQPPVDTVVPPVHGSGSLQPPVRPTPKQFHAARSSQRRPVSGARSQR